MAIVNRNKDVSEQLEVVRATAETTVTGKASLVGRMPYAATIVRGSLSAVGLSGSPTAQFAIRRFVTGAGETLIPLGAALALVATSTSGPQSYTFSATALIAGDMIAVSHAGTNAGVEQLGVAVVVQAIQSIKSWTF
jgi:hypothetical protein